MKNILVVGDIMVDHYVHVTSSRRAQEAPVPVWDVVFTDYRFGGAANVALNVKSLMGEDAEVFLAGIVGDEDRYALQQRGVDMSMCVAPADTAVSMTKTRYVIDGKIVARVDSFKSYDQFDAIEVAFNVSGRQRNFDVAIVSDYDKGTVNPKTVFAMSAVPLKIVDSKREELDIFRGFDLLKVNAAEHGAQSGREKALESLFKHVVVTLGEQGAELRQFDDSKVHEITSVNRNAWSLIVPRIQTNVIHTEMFPVCPVHAVDVTGCGDTHTAAMAVEMCRSGDIREAVRFGNECARKAVAVFGTVVVKP